MYVCVCVCVTLFIQHEMPMHHSMLLSVAFLAVLYFSTLPHKQHDFLKKENIENNMCFFIFSTTFVKKIPRYKKNLAR